MRRTLICFAALLAATIVAPSAVAQATPLAGKPGVIGTPYRIATVQFILTGASFATRFVHAEDTFVAEAGKKLLVLNYTVQNPGKELVQYDWTTLRFTVVGADDTNHEDAQLVVNPDKLTKISAQLKPAQKIPAITVIQVPANDPIPKLMVTPDGGGPNAGGLIIRYDLKGKVKKHVGVYASDGVTVNDTGIGKLAEATEVGRFDVTVEKVEDVTTTLIDRDPEEGKKFIVVTMSIKNAGMVAQQLDWSVFEPEMKDPNDERIDYAQLLLRAVGNAAISEEIKPGQTVRARMVFQADTATSGKSLILKWGSDGRSVTFNLK